MAAAGGRGAAAAPAADERTKLMLLTGDYYVNKNSIFTPEARIRLNFVPIVLNTVLPWTLFVVLLTVSIFRFRHDYGKLCDTVWLLLVGGLFLLYVWLFFKELHGVDARWTRASFLYLVVMVNLCATASYLLYSEFFEPYYDVLDLKTYPMLDVSKTNGKDVMDAGMIYFAPNTKIDFTRAWHFKQKDVYCVAPLVKPDSLPFIGKKIDTQPKGQGKGAMNDDFRCPGYDSAKARAGLRILRDDSLQLYRLAVQQAETQYGFLSTYPVFVEWVEDPVYVLEDIKSTMEMRSTGLAVYFILIFAALFLQMVLVCFCVLRFSLIGRL
eukprot:g11683.t1